ncbi:hypothetical protein T05_114 [Trichinella murrelli]|uniref:Uncharacterized protein n=1 Tax=Trichinella murrelli TaxID=144512 RepID=A0A0V0T3T5_9BILA|nr:hypothetical protein T05_114 [Trichinella murrelli]
MILRTLKASLESGKISFLVLSSFVSLITSYYWNKISTRSVIILVLFLRLRLRLCLGHFSKIFRFFKNLAPGVARGYASGHKKICIFPQATPQAFYCTIFALRDGLCKFFIAWGQYANFLCPQATPRAMPQAFFQKFSIFQKFSPRRSPGLCLRA